MMVTRNRSDKSEKTLAAARKATARDDRIDKWSKAGIPDPITSWLKGLLENEKELAALTQNELDALDEKNREKYQAAPGMSKEFIKSVTSRADRFVHYYETVDTDNEELKEAWNAIKTRILGDNEEEKNNNLIQFFIHLPDSSQKHLQSKLYKNTNVLKAKRLALNKFGKVFSDKFFNELNIDPDGMTSIILNASRESSKGRSASYDFQKVKREFIKGLQLLETILEEANSGQHIRSKNKKAKNVEFQDYETQVAELNYYLNQNEEPPQTAITLIANANCPKFQLDDGNVTRRWSRYKKNE